MVPGKAIKSYEIFKYKKLFNIIYKLHPSLPFLHILHLAILHV